jgi:hypothetical protein
MRSLGFLIPGLLVLMGASNAAEWAVGKDSRIEVVYITAADCVYCKSWRYTRAGDWARFSRTPAASHVALVTVDKTTLRNFITREHYPAAYGHLFDLAPQFGNVVPAWWVLLDGKPVTRRVGEGNWATGIEPMLEQLVAAKSSGGGLVVHNAPPIRKPMVPANVADVNNVPYLSARGKESYRRFLVSGLPRAFALSPDGTYSWKSGRRRYGQEGAGLLQFPCI